MVDLHLYLEHGFFEDTIEIMINGVKVYHNEKLTTHAVLGLADSKTISVPMGLVNLEVFIKNRGVSKNLQADVSNKRHLALSLYDNTLTHRFSEEPFDYM